MESSLGPCKLDHGGLEPNAVAIYEEVMYDDGNAFLMGTSKPLWNWVDEFIPYMKTQGVEVQPSHQKKCSKIRSLMTSHDIIPSNRSRLHLDGRRRLRRMQPKRRSCGLATWRKLRCLRQKVVLRGKTWGFPTWEQKVGPPQKKSTNCILYTCGAIRGTKKNGRKYGFRWFFSNPESKWS